MKKWLQESIERQTAHVKEEDIYEEHKVTKAIRSADYIILCNIIYNF